MILIVAALVVLGLLLIAHIHGPVIALLRAAGEMVLGVFEALLHAIEQLRQGLSTLSTRAWEGLRNHHGRDRTTDDYWPRSTCCCSWPRRRSGGRPSCSPTSSPWGRR